jgi:hypothetical protein
MLMHGRETRASSDLIGVAGRCGSEEEKAYVKQAVFLLRYRMRCIRGEVTPAPSE